MNSKDISQFKGEYTDPVYVLNVNTQFLVVKCPGILGSVKVYNKYKDLFTDPDYLLDDSEESIKACLRSDVHNCPWTVMLKSGAERQQIIDTLLLLGTTNKRLMEEHLLPFIRNNNRFTEVVFETENYVGVKWYGKSWLPCRSEDLVKPFPYTSETKRYHYVKTPYFKKVLKEFVDIFNHPIDIPKEYTDALELLATTDPAIIAQYHIERYKSSGSDGLEALMHYVQVVADSIVVKREGGEIIDWKFVHLHRLTVSDRSIIYDDAPQSQWRVVSL